MKKQTHGGKRKGAGRKKETEPRKRFTKLVPISKYDAVVQAVNSVLKPINK